MKTIAFFPLVTLMVCFLQTASADTSIANKSLTSVINNHTPHLQPSLPVSTEKKQTSLTPLTVQGKLENLIETTRFIRGGAGLLGKNVTTIISKDIVGLQYTKKW